MAKILVTGASGFIGFHVIRELVEQGHEITCLVRKKSSLDRLAGLTFRRLDGDVRDEGSLARAVAGQDAVYHLAGLITATRVEHLYQVNCEGTAKVARACAGQLTPPVLLVVSSLAAMGPSSPHRPRVESDPPAPVSNYGRSKLAGELEARKWAKELPITIFRPPIVFGEADQATFEIFRPIARYGIHVVPCWRMHWLSLIHAEDLAIAMILAGERGCRLAAAPADDAANAQGCYFIAAERDLTVPELGRMMGAALGRRHTFVMRFSVPVVWTAGLIATAFSRLRGRPSYFNLDKAREALAGSWTCSCAAAKRDLRFAVAKSLEDRLRQTARWYQEKGWL